MALIIQNLKTNNAAQPIYSVSAADKTIAAMLNLATWIKAETSYFSSDKFSWYDALTGVAYPVTGTLNNAASLNGIAAAQFTKTQSVDLGSPMNIGGDWTKVFVISPRSTPTEPQGVMGGKIAAPNSHATYMGASGASARISMVQNGTVAGGTTNQTVGMKLLAMQTYKASTGNAKVYINGILGTDYGSGIASATDATTVLGGMPGNNAGAPLDADVAEVLIFKRDLSVLLAGQAATDMAVLSAFLKAKYAV